MTRTQNLLLILAIIALAVFPLMYVQKPAPDAEGNVAEIFAGADDKAKDLVSVINPESGLPEPYQPCIDWSQAGPILADEWYELETMLIEWFGPHWPHLQEFRDNSLVWFMRALVALRFGDEVEELSAEA